MYHELFLNFSVHIVILSSVLHTYRMYHMYGPLLHFCVHCAIFYTVTFCNGRLGNLWFGTLTTSCFLLWSCLTLWRFLTQETVTLFCSPGSNLSYCHVVQISSISLTQSVLVCQYGTFQNRS